MNAPAAGWNPDPTGRHEYRYWDGGRWTDDVSDHGVTSLDPVGGPTPGAEPTTPLDPTSQFDPQAGPYGPDTATATRPFEHGGGPSGPYPPATVRKKGLSPGVIIGIAAAAIALIVGAVVVLSQDDDGGSSATGDNTAQTTPGDSRVTLPDGGDATVPSVPDDQGGSGGDGGTVGGVDPEIIKSVVSAGLKNQGFTDEQADCAADVVVDQLGDRLTDLDPSQNPLGQLSEDERSQLIDSLQDCGVDDLSVP
jgi:hypothetical protein